MNAFYQNDKSKILQFCKSQRSKKLVFTNGCFDILHIGHIEYLNKSATFGDILVVGINSDKSVRELKGDGRPLNSELNRAKIISSLKNIDAAIIFDEKRCTDLIYELEPDIYVKGGDYTVDTLDRSEYKALLDCKTEIHIIPILTNISTTQILNKI